MGGVAHRMARRERMHTLSSSLSRVLASAVVTAAALSGCAMMCSACGAKQGATQKCGGSKAKCGACGGKK